MQPISERARRIVDDLKQGLASLPVEERAEVVRRATETLTLLHNDARTLYQTLQASMNKNRTGEQPSQIKENGDVENISDYL